MVGICLALAAAGCSTDDAPAEGAPTATVQAAATTAAADEGGGEVALELTSTAYSDGEAVPARYTCDGENVSPPLAWTGVPQETATFALMFDDPDAPGGTWVHWVLFNIPGQTRSLAEGQPGVDELPDGSRHGANSWRRRDYGGPCPPSGTHRYVLKLYALDTALQVAPGATTVELMGAMAGHVLAQAELLGTYSRQ
jgi:Raf kinase inhibitor-like YbhB/YbcL family protein